MPAFVNRQFARHALLTAVLTLAVAACDRGASTLAPRENATARAAATVPAPTVPVLSWTYVADTAVNVFTVPATNGAQFVVDLDNGNRIVFPSGSGSICDPGTSGYGLDSWNRSCTPLRRDITFRLKAWTDGAGRPHVDFSPSVRFVPVDGKPVMLYLYTPSGAASWISRILYCATPTSLCSDESIFDTSLRTYADQSTGYVFRRIKHFSGYNVVAD